MGKFPNDTVEALYSWSLNGFCDDSGDVEAPTGWYCRIDIDSIVVQTVLNDCPDLKLDADELRGAWLLYEDNQGFVEATHFTTGQARNRAWDRLEAAYSRWCYDEDIDN